MVYAAATSVWPTSVERGTSAPVRSRRRRHRWAPAMSWSPSTSTPRARPLVGKARSAVSSSPRGIFQARAPSSAGDTSTFSAVPSARRPGPPGSCVGAAEDQQAVIGGGLEGRHRVEDPLAEREDRVHEPGGASRLENSSRTGSRPHAPREDS